MNPYTPLPDVPLLRGRQDFVLNACRGKRILHLGCVDAGLTLERFQRGELLHQRLSKVASMLWGVDIDAAGIAFLCEHGFTNLLVADISLSGNELAQSQVDDVMQRLREQEFDIILATEVLEHLPNPANFLAAVQRLMIPGRTQFIVTVPNAFRIDTLLWMWRGVEYVHPDHNYWFSYATITTLLRKMGFHIDQVLPYSFQPSQVVPNRIRRLLRPTRREENAAATVSSSAVSAPRRSAGSYFKTLPKRLLAAVLYGRTPFWGDGLLVVATVDAHA